MSKVRVRLTKKLAEMIDGVDISRRTVGDSFRVSIEDARLLIAEQWAVPAEPRQQPKTEAESDIDSSPPELI